MCVFVHSEEKVSLFNFISRILVSSQNMCILKAPHFRNSEHETPGIDLFPVSALIKAKNKSQLVSPATFILPKAEGTVMLCVIHTHFESVHG